MRPIRPPGALPWRESVAPIAAISVFGLSISMGQPLLSLVLERMGASGGGIGLSTMAGALAMVVFAPLMPRVMAAVGLGRLIAGAVVGLAGLMLLFPVVADYWGWIALRLAYGACATAVFFAAEYWIVAAAPAGARGRVVALYTISLSLSFVVGPLVVGATGVDGLLPFAVAAAVLLAGLLPVLWGLGAMPRPGAEAPPTPLASLRFFVSDPTVVWAVVVFGMIEFGAVALLPVWAVRSGLSEDQAVVLMASFAAGAAVVALPLGWLAERADRRRLLLLLALLTAAAPVAMVLAAPSVAGVVVFGMVWGAGAVGLYTLPLVELGARYSGHRLAEGNAAIVLAYGVGALVSPGLLGLAMDVIPPDGVLLTAAAGTLAYAALAALRIAATRRRP